MRKERHTVEPVIVSAPLFEPTYDPPPAATEPEPEPAHEENCQPQLSVNDLDMPAYLRRDRQYYRN